MCDRAIDAEPVRDRPRRDRLPRGGQIALAERDQRVDVAHRLGELDIVGLATEPDGEGNQRASGTLND